MKVILEIFSGRPNPSFSLSSEEALTIRARLALLSWAECDAPPETNRGLGYRGFIISTESEIPDVGYEILVYRSSIVAMPSREGSKHRCATDEARTLEQQLLGTARKYLASSDVPLSWIADQ